MRPSRRPPPNGSIPAQYGLHILQEVIEGIAVGAQRAGRSPKDVTLAPIGKRSKNGVIDGAIEQVDSLRSTYEGATRTGYTVLADPLDAALSHPGIVARQIGVEALSATCRACTVHRVCGGGHYAHRYRPGSGFRSPSVYCRDLYRIIAHVRRRVTDDLARLASGSMA